MEALQAVGENGQDEQSKQDSEGVYLSEIQIQNFRGISSLSVEFHRGVNVLIGENRACKTAVLDALRLCLGYALERRDIYIQSEDFFIDAESVQASAIDFQLTFAGPSLFQQGIFLELLSMSSGTPNLLLHVRFTRDADRIRRVIWGGDNEGQEVPPGVLELLYYTHLGALRDATRDLAPSRSNRLSQLFLKLVPEKDRPEYATAINDQVQGVECWKLLIKEATDKIENHLSAMVTSGDDGQVAIGFVGSDFRNIAESMRLQIPLSGGQAKPNAKSNTGIQSTPATLLTVSQNSLGYNNLLYIATVLGDLLEKRAAEPLSYTSLLIEEPEAHLHPHWQNTLFRYLRTIESHGVQVFVTSHSPTIAAKSDLDSLVILNRRGHEDIHVVPLRRIGLPDADKKHLQRFIDVTKSQLFFARSVLLVEGISEALLMPEFARLLGAEFDLEKNAVEVVNIDGVAFAPFAALFNGTGDDASLGIRCSLLTDDDRNENTISNRASKAKDLEGGRLKVFLAEETFEYELYIENEDTVLEVYKQLHPKTDFPAAGTVESRARYFVEKLRVNKDKGVFSQNLAAKLQDANSLVFVVPKYIQSSLEWAIHGTSSTD
jgi:putative ATP-dependent endonuclease of OLD family